MSLMDHAKRVAEQIIGAQEQARLQQKPKKETTFPLEWGNIAVDGTFEVCDVNGEGDLHEFLVLAASTSFFLTVILDGRRLEGSYTDFADKSRDIDEISAFQSGSNYRIHLTKIPFSENLRIYVKGNLTLTRVFLKYTLKE